MSTADVGRERGEPARAALRGAVLRDASQLVEARDVLVVRSGDLGEARLVEGLVCGEHWTGGTQLDLRHEPILVQALVSDRIVRCCPRRPRRICGPYWSTAATVVPHRMTGIDAVVAVFGGGARQPSPDRAREAAATVAALLEPESAPAPPDGVGWGVLVVRVAAAIADPALLDAALLDPALADVDREVAQVLRMRADEVCVIVRSGGVVVCERIADAVRSAAVARTPSVGVGWAISAPGRPMAWALDVARAMAEHDERAVRSANEEVG